MTPPPPDLQAPSLSRRSTLLLPVVLAGLSMLGPFSIDTPFPAFAAMQRDLNVGIEGTQQLVSTYLLSFAVMSLFHGPLSDALGRKPVMIGGLAAYGLASVGCALSPTLPVLLGFRVLQGLAAGGGVIVSRTVIRDLYDGPQAQRLMSRVMMIFSIAPAVAPIIGGYLLRLGPWPVIFWFLAGVSLVLIALVALVLPETHPVEHRVPFAPGPLLAGLSTIARSVAFHRVAWAGALAFGAQFLYIGSAAIFVVDLLHRGTQDFWMFFVPMISGVALGAWVSGRLAGRVSGRRIVLGGQLFGVLGAGVNLAIALSPVGAQVPYAVVGPGLVAFGTAVAWPTMQLVVLDMFPDTRGAAASALTVIPLVLNALTAGVLAPLVTRSVGTLAATCLAMTVAGLAMWTWHLRASRRVAMPEPATVAGAEPPPD